MECAAKPKAVRFVPDDGSGGGWDGVGGGEGNDGGVNGPVKKGAGMGNAGCERGGNKADRLKWTWKDGRLRVTVPRLEIHGVVLVD